ncbi:hypothetical protein GQ457_10G009570 [Hibiscus cannabinus]
MRSEMNSMSKNQVWTLVEQPEGIKPIGCKWVFKKKTDMDGNVQTYMGRLVAKVPAFHDYEIWQMDVKTAFRNGKLEEDVYMTQPEGFVTPENARKVFADAESSNKSTKPIGDNTNDKDAISYAPMTLAHNAESIGLNGSTLTPTTAPFDEFNEFLDFLANPTEANGDIPSLYDNLGLESTVVTALPIPMEEELEKDIVGWAFLFGASSSLE